MSVFRRDPITGRWTILIPERGPAFATAPPKTTPDAAHKTFCPFCPGNETKTPNETFAIKDENGHWLVRSVPNKFPILDAAARPDPMTDGPHDKMGGFGIHEVVIETPNHHGRFATHSIVEARAVVSAWWSRLTEIGRDPRVKYVLLFRNHGARAGASLAHPHSQIIALPILPKLVREENEQARRYYEWKERCVFCDMAREEARQGVRLIDETPRFVSFTPYASRFAYEIWILPKEHRPRFEDLIEDERNELADLLRLTLKRLDLALDDPPFNLLLHTTPCHEGESPHYHWHFEIMPRLASIAGFEWGTGFYLNPVLPEDAAKKLLTHTF
jgi:UDPglucose--hexose-1-phosphate uridylyltransferase